jgi:hypothetical protein
MSRHEARGIKRICNNDECALPFYDLNRLDCSCPNCGTAFEGGAAMQAAKDAHNRLKLPRAARPVELPRGPARPIVEEPEKAADSDDAQEAVDSEDVADNILELDDEDADDVEVEKFPDRATDE